MSIILILLIQNDEHGDGGDGDGDDGDSDESDGNGEDEVKPRIVSSQLLKEGPVDGEESTWAFYKCVTYSNELWSCSSCIHY